MPIALVGFSEDYALYTSDSDIVLSLTDKRGTGSVSRDGVCGVMCCYVMRGVCMLTSHARVLECSVCLCTVYMLCIRC